MAILPYFTTFTMKRGDAGSWNSGLEKEQILETYSAQLQKSWNSTEVIFGNNKNPINFQIGWSLDIRL